MQTVGLFGKTVTTTYHHQQSAIIPKRIKEKYYLNFGVQIGLYWVILPLDLLILNWFFNWIGIVVSFWLKLIRLTLMLRIKIMPTAKQCKKNCTFLKYTFNFWSFLFIYLFEFYSLTDGTSPTMKTHRKGIRTISQSFVVLFILYFFLYRISFLAPKNMCSHISMYAVRPVTHICLTICLGLTQF